MRRASSDDSLTDAAAPPARRRHLPGSLGQWIAVPTSAGAAHAPFFSSPAGPTSKTLVPPVQGLLCATDVDAGVSNVTAIELARRGELLRQGPRWAVGTPPVAPGTTRTLTDPGAVPAQVLLMDLVCTFQPIEWPHLIAIGPQSAIFADIPLAAISGLPGDVTPQLITIGIGGAPGALSVLIVVVAPAHVGEVSAHVVAWHACRPFDDVYFCDLVGRRLGVDALSAQLPVGHRGLLAFPTRAFLQ